MYSPYKKRKDGINDVIVMFFFFSLIRWTSSLPSCLWSLRIFPSLPGSRLPFFLSRCKFNTLIMVEFYLLTFPRFPLKKEHKSYFGKNPTHDFLATSRCAGSLLDHSTILGKCDISKETKTKKTVKKDTDTVGRMQFEEWLNEGPRILENKKRRKRSCDPFAPKIIVEFFMEIVGIMSFCFCRFGVPPWQLVYKCVVCVLSSHIFWAPGLRAYQPGSHRNKATQDFKSPFLLRCLP